MSTKSSCSGSSTWAKSIPSENIQNKPLDHHSWETSSAIAQQLSMGKRYHFAGRHREVEMGLDGLLVVARTFPDGAISGSSWPGQFRHPPCGRAPGPAPNQIARGWPGREQSRNSRRRRVGWGMRDWPMRTRGQWSPLHGGGGGCPGTGQERLLTPRTSRRWTAMGHRPGVSAGAASSWMPKVGRSRMEALWRPLRGCGSQRGWGVVYSQNGYIVKHDYIFRNPLLSISRVSNLWVIHLYEKKNITSRIYVRYTEFQLPYIHQQYSVATNIFTLAIRCQQELFSSSKST
jgi:hypothetical protein